MFDALEKFGALRRREPLDPTHNRLQQGEVGLGLGSAFTASSQTI
jgi:hypothetical protein